MSNFRIQILATGGTLAKRYDTQLGQLVVDNAGVDDLVARLALPDVEIHSRRLLAVDSLDMTAEQRATVAAGVRAHAEDADAIIIIHGTDTLVDTAKVIEQAVPDVAVPVVLTGAMVPFACAASDALPNVAQAIVACRLLTPGVHVVMHGRALNATHAVKDYDAMTFVPAAD